MTPYGFKSAFLATVAAASIVAAFLIRVREGALPTGPGFALLTIWIFVPPLWLVLESAQLRRDGGPMTRVYTLRNLWLAGIVVLGMILGLRWPPF